MPIYEYECTTCGNIEEVLQKISDKPLCTCPECSGKLQKLVSQSSFHLKGTGWYVTDYAGKKSNGDESKKKGGEKTPSPDKSSSSKKKSKKKIE